MPALGMAQETGKLLRWLKAEGEPVAKGEPLMEIETDKVTVEIEAPADGTLGGVSAAEGDDVPVGRAVAFILAAGEAAPSNGSAASDNGGSGQVPVSETEARLEGTADGGSGQVPVSETEARLEATATAPAAAVAAPARRALASPKARRLARENGVPLEQVTGSGPYGAVQAADVAAFTAGAVSVATAGTVADAAPADDHELPVSSAWKTMAARMQESWQQVPHFFLQRDVDATRLDSWRETTRRRAGYERVSHTDLLVKLCAAALERHPRVNARWQDGRIVGSGRANIGIAVATDDALIVPVVHDAGRLDLLAISERRRDLVDRARSRKLGPDDVAGASFTISNLGMYGVDAFQAIVPAPQAAILAVGRILDRIVAVDGAAAVRPTLTLTLSFDHRVVDGAAGARFLDTLADLIEEPAGLVA
jgi:pyruvate dehydrogenase E2 component (dihydrolipoamide acetyltransferase)